MQIEINERFVRANTNLRIPGGGTLMVTPPIDEDYWLLRVRLNGTQAIVGFPKFGTIGVGFQREEDWNTNLPYSCGAMEIFEHISHNKGDDAIADDDCIAAIELVRQAAELYMASRDGRN